MNGKREALAALGWAPDLIDAFLESDVSAGIEDYSQGHRTPAPTYVDQGNVMIEMPSAALLSGVALRSNKEHSRRAKRAMHSKHKREKLKK